MIIIMMMDGVDDHHNDDDDDSQAMTGHTDHILSLYTWGGAMFVRFFITVRHLHRQHNLDVYPIVNLTIIANAITMSILTKSRNNIFLFQPQPLCTAAVKIKPSDSGI